MKLSLLLIGSLLRMFSFSASATDSGHTGQLNKPVSHNIQAFVVAGPAATAICDWMCKSFFCYHVFTRCRCGHMRAGAACKVRG